MKNLILSFFALVLFIRLSAQSGGVLNISKISATSGSFTGLINDYQYFGRGICNIGDVNKDGYSDLAISARNNSTLEGAIFILFLDNNFKVKSYQIIERNVNGLNGTFSSMQFLGLNSIANIGDLDNDGINEIAVGNSTGGGNSRGEVFILFLNSGGSVKSFKIIGPNTLILDNNNDFGSSITTINDIDKDGVREVVVGAPGDNDGGAERGALYILYLTNSGDLKSFKKISSTKGSFHGVISNGAHFGRCLTSIGDLNKDGQTDVVTASLGNTYELWVLFLDTIGNVKTHKKIDSDSGNYKLYDRVRSFGSISNLGDIDGDTNSDLVLGNYDDSVNNISSGVVRIVYLLNNGNVKDVKKISNQNLTDQMEADERFGYSIAYSNDLDNNFKSSILIGSDLRDDGGSNKGAIYLLSLDGAVHPTPPKALWRVNATSGNQNTVFNFTQYSTGFPSAYKWSITPNTFTYQGGTSDTSANPIIKFNQTANYSVQLKVTNPFSSDSLLRSSYISVQKVGVNNVEKNYTAISIFPNPTNGLVQIQSPINIQTILVFDITGKQLLQQEPNAQTDEINISNLPQGLYQIHVQTEMGVLVKKLIKE
jgi:PKD repeat protein